MRSKILITFAGFLASAALAQEPAQTSHALKSDTPMTGSHIRHDIATGWEVPLNKTYAQLTPAQVEAFKSNYEPMAAGDEPPFPIKGMGSIIRAISKAMEVYPDRGQLFLVARIDRNGNALSVDVFSAPSPEIAQFVGEVLMLEKYKPAVCGGMPCVMDFPLSVELARKL
jgi:hypothetical protein